LILDEVGVDQRDTITVVATIAGLIVSKWKFLTRATITVGVYNVVATARPYPVATEVHFRQVCRR
jgi:hypothetical protein